MNKKRTGKFYRRNEEEVMCSLGFEPTPNSGSGWVVKEDGQNDVGICQLKSTDANSIKINLKDLQTLEYNATVAHKVPVFAIQFLGTNDVWILGKPDTLCNISKFIATGKSDTLEEFIGVDLSECKDVSVSCERTTVKSSLSARERFNEENKNKFKKKKRSAK